MNEVFLNLVVLAPAQENAEGRIHRAPGAAHLLVIRDHRPGPLEVDDEPEVRFVKAHAQRDGGDQGFHLVAEELLLGLDALVRFQIGMVGARGNASAA